MEYTYVPFHFVLAVCMDRTKTTKYQLAKKMGIHQTTVKNWLEGKSEPRASELARIADALDIPAASFFIEYIRDTDAYLVISSYLEHLRAKVSNEGFAKPEYEWLASLLQVAGNLIYNRIPLEAAMDETARIALSGPRQKPEWVGEAYCGGEISEFPAIYSQLNEAGKRECMKRLQELSRLTEYQQS